MTQPDGHMLEEMSWEDFLSTGVLAFLNTFLHLFGLAIVCVMDEEGEVTRVYPARCRYRGYDLEEMQKSYEALTHHLAANLPALGQDLML